MAKAKATEEKVKKSKAKTYDEDSIEALKFPENVRKKSGMYLGEKGPEMVRRSLKELTDNAIDEALAGRNNYVETVINHKRNEYIVADAGAGVPVGIHKTEKVPTIELVFAALHAGGKFSDSAYKTSSGTHGLGAACTNATSEYFEVWTKRDGVWYNIVWQEGLRTQKLKQIKAPPKELMDRLQRKAKDYGTIILFRPDQHRPDLGIQNTVEKRTYGNTWISEYRAYPLGFETFNNRICSNHFAPLLYVYSDFLLLH